MSRLVRTWMGDARKEKFFMHYLHDGGGLDAISGGGLQSLTYARASPPQLVPKAARWATNFSSSVGSIPKASRSAVLMVRSATIWRYHCINCTRL